eukprot:scaffold14848_cov79-Skeletonema_marinoi.AAC.1
MSGWCLSQLRGELVEESLRVLPVHHLNWDGPNFSKVGAGATVMSKVGRFWVFGSDFGYFGAFVGHEFPGHGGGRYRLLIFTYVWITGIRWRPDGYIL